LSDCGCKGKEDSKTQRGNIKKLSPKCESVTMRADYQADTN
jgi:hypothetical protein